jgi:hypothetical protein
MNNFRENRSEVSATLPYLFGCSGSHGLGCDGNVQICGGELHGII